MVGLTKYLLLTVWNVYLKHIFKYVFVHSVKFSVVKFNHTEFNGPPFIMFQMWIQDVKNKSYLFLIWTLIYLLKVEKNELNAKVLVENLGVETKNDSFRIEDFFT